MTSLNSVCEPEPKEMRATNPDLASCEAEGKSRSIVPRIRKFLGSGSQGGALVEMALAFPLIMIMLTGIFSFSTAFYQKLLLAEAVSAGGRFLAVDRGDTDPCATTAAKIYAAAPTLNSTKISLTFNLNGTSTGATCPGPSNGINTNLVTGGTAEVTASYPCALSVYGREYASCTLTSQITEVVQ